MSFLEGVLRRPVFGAVLCVSLLSACASSNPEQVPPSARQAEWLVAPLILPDTTVSGHNRWSEHRALASALSELLGDADQPFAIMGGGDRTQWLSVDAFYRRVAVDDGETDFRVRPSVLDSLRETTGARYVLAAQSSSWSTTSGRKARDLGVAVIAAVATTAVGLGPVVMMQPQDGATVVFDLIDTHTKQTVSGGAYSTKEDAPLPAARELLYGMITGRTIPPGSLNFEADQDVIVYRVDGPTVRGRLTDIEGYDLVVETRDDADARVSLVDVSTIKSTSQNRKIFPIARSE